YMGLGEVLMEEHAFVSLPAHPGLRPSLNGLHKGPSMLDYKSPTTLEMPEIISFVVESIDPKGPFGAKEAGEGPIVPTMPAVLNAIYDAIGVRIDEVPVTPEKVLKALDEKEKGKKEGRYGPSRFPSVPYPEGRRVDPPPQWQSGEYRDE
ncbi:MAG TPA: hypothetical protein VI877_02630, partial [Dehalococcoidia bacterium]|nr:hypothetical protein [Dehalococcoidia bacterium]